MYVDKNFFKDSFGSIKVKVESITKNVQKYKLLITLNEKWRLKVSWVSGL